MSDLTNPARLNMLALTIQDLCIEIRKDSFGPEMGRVLRMVDCVISAHGDCPVAHFVDQIDGFVERQMGLHFDQDVNSLLAHLTELVDDYREMLPQEGEDD